MCPGKGRNEFQKRQKDRILIIIKTLVNDKLSLVQPFYLRRRFIIETGGISVDEGRMQLEIAE